MEEMGAEVVEGCEAAAKEEVGSEVMVEEEE